MPKPRHTLDMDVDYELNKFLDENLERLTPEEKDPKKRLVKYKNGWTDEKVAIKFDATLDQVKRRREKIFGVLTLRTKEPPPPPCPGQLDEVYHRIGELERQMKEVVDALTRPSFRDSRPSQPLQDNGAKTSFDINGIGEASRS